MGYFDFPRRTNRKRTRDSVCSCWWSSISISTLIHWRGYLLLLWDIWVSSSLIAALSRWSCWIGWTCSLVASYIPTYSRIRNRYRFRNISIVLDWTKTEGNRIPTSLLSYLSLFRWIPCSDRSASDHRVISHANKMVKLDYRLPILVDDEEN